MTIAGRWACVVVPARDEEELIGACVARARRAGRASSRDDYEVLLVLDRCTDATEARARAAAGDADAARRSQAERRRASAHARRLGHGPRRERLLARPGRPDRLHRRRLRARARLAARAARRRRARARARSAGAIELGAEHDLPPRRAAPARGRRRRQRRARAARRRARASTTSSAARRWRVTAATYAQVGRLEPRAGAGGRGLRARAAPPRRPDRAARRACGSPPPAGASAARRAGSRSTCAATRWLAERSYDARRLRARRSCVARKDRRRVA